MAGGAVAGGVIGGIGSILAGQSTSKTLQYNAQIQENNANAALTSASLNADKQELQAQRVIGQAKANYGASGVSATSGSVLNVIAASAGNAELDRQNTLYGGQVKATNYENQASLDSFEADQTMKGAWTSAIGGVITAGIMSNASGGGGGGSTSGGGLTGENAAAGGELSGEDASALGDFSLGGEGAAAAGGGADFADALGVLAF